MDNLYYILLFYALYRAIRGVFRINSSIDWISRSSKKLNRNSNRSVKQYILIPVLREHEVIKTAFSIFTKLNGKYKLVFITTEKEVHEHGEIKNELVCIKGKILKARNIEKFIELTSGIFPQTVATDLFGKSWIEIKRTFDRLLTTEQILKRLLLKSSKAVRNKVSVYRYPKNDGKMSDQLNYAISKISKEIDSSKVFVSIYNADSVVDQKMPLYISNYIKSNPKAKVIQQSALFLSNYNNLGNSISGSFLKSIALLQSRWTLAHELPRIFAQYKNKISAFFECAHVVGHGLIIRLDTLIQTGGFPTGYINEDLPLGYILKLHGNTIYPFPLLENAQSPVSVKSMFIQYTTWFYGVFSYPLYTLHAWNDFKDKRLQVLVWGLKYSLRSVLWLFSSLAWIILFTYPIFIKNYLLFLVVVIIFVFYSPFSFYLMTKKLNKLSAKVFGKKIYSSIHINMTTYLMTFFAYITHSYGPLLATLNVVKSFVFKSNIKKQKTER